MAAHLWPPFLLIMFCFPVVWAQDSKAFSSRPDKFLDNATYDRWVRPGHEISQLPISVRMYIYFLGAIEAHNLQFTAHVLITYRWVDKRLRHEHGPIEGEGLILLNKIWTPHIYIVNEHESKVLGSGQDILVSIHNDGTVSYSARMQITLLCAMNLKKFPFDYQLCPFTLESWGYNSSEIILNWDEIAPVTINKDLELTEYALADKWTSENNNTYTIPDLRQKKDTLYSKFYGNYSSLTVFFRFEREVGHYIMDYYVPSMLLVVVSWVSFWLDPNAVPGRTTLGTSTMLTFITLSRNIGSSLPKVSYIKATEIWFIVCTGFIFGSLVEFAFVNTIWRRRANVELKKVTSRHILRSTLTPQVRRKDCSSNSNQSIVSMSEASCPKAVFPTKYNTHLSVSSIANLKKDPLQFSSQQSIITDDDQLNNKSEEKGFFTMTPQEIAQWIDRRSRVVFPSCFILFNVVYWISLCIEF